MMEKYTLYRGDCLEIIDDLPMVSAVVTDPPYMINTKSDGNGKLNPWSDYCNGAHWYTAWIRKVREHLKPDGCLWTCMSWRSFVTFQKAACDAGWPIESLLVWDKQRIGPGGLKGLRPSYELVALFAMPEFQIPNRGLPDIQRFKWSSKKPHDHPAEKPEDLMRWLIENSTKEGDTVLDLFMGSGTTGAAAISAGRKFIGIEQDEKWYKVAAKRIEEAAALAGGGGTVNCHSPAGTFHRETKTERSNNP